MKEDGKTDGRRVSGNIRSGKTMHMQGDGNVENLSDTVNCGSLLVSNCPHSGTMNIVIFSTVGELTFFLVISRSYRMRQFRVPFHFLKILIWEISVIYFNPVSWSKLFLLVCGHRHGTQIDSLICIIFWS